MHGRSIRLALSTCLFAAALAPPAWSAPTFTPPCAGNWNGLGLDDPALDDETRSTRRGPGPRPGQRRRRQRHHHRKVTRR